LPFVLYGCRNFSLILREEQRLRVLENRILRKAFEPKREEVTGEWTNCIMRCFMICAPSTILNIKAEQKYLCITKHHKMKDHPAFRILYVFKYHKLDTVKCK
jgi:hypothetical protein